MNMNNTWFYKIIAIVLTGLLLQGCEMNKQGAGTLAGGAAGALLGSRFGKGTGSLVATGVGALAGAFIGGQIGKTMDENDKKLAALSAQKALETAPSGQSIAWSNPDNGHSGSITPIKTYQNEQGQYCREYNQMVVISGKQEKAYGRACRQPDGAWQIVQ